ncbi:MAG: PEGA domain-containing protein [Planctomycetota bacterium]
MNRRTVFIVLLAFACTLPGCLQRRISITTEPPGARVWVNDVEIGQSPAETDFLYYGVYDIRIDHPDFEPVLTEREAGAPFWEYPGIDLIAEALPFTIENTVEWHFDLVPAIETYAEPDALDAELIDRARATRARLEADAR